MGVWEGLGGVWAGLRSGIEGKYDQNTLFT